MDSHQDPKKLIDLAKNGDSEAFSALYKLYFVPVFRYIFLRTKSKQDTEDLTQTVFLKVYSSISRFQEQGKSPLAYLFTVARNTVIDHWKKKREVILDDPMRAEGFSDNTNENPYQTIEKDEAARSIQGAIVRLSEEQKEVIVLKFMNELSNQEIASILGKSEESVRQLQCRALKAMRQYFKNTP